ncbi:hypothetical protein EIV52_22290 [Salmonella enterica]|nr:hypothetical protein [Salmonella enterica]
MPCKAMALPCTSAQDGQATLWLSVLAFGKQADVLAKHTKGDVVSVMHMSCRPEMSMTRHRHTVMMRHSARKY